MKTEVHICDFCASEGLRKAVATCTLCGKDFCSEAHAGRQITVRVHDNIVMSGEPLCKGCGEFANMAHVDFPADVEVDAAAKLLRNKYIEHLRMKWAARALDPTSPPLPDTVSPKGNGLPTAEEMLSLFREHQKQAAQRAAAATGWPKPPSVNYK